MDGSGIYWAVTVEVHEPNIAILTKNGSPMAKLANNICPDDLELRKSTCPTPFVEVSTISSKGDVVGASFVDFSVLDGVVVESHSCGVDNGGKRDAM